MFASLGSSWGGEGDPGWLTWVQNLVIVSFALIPLAIGVSVLRYRLFDIDVVINRAVLFGALAVFITLVYVAIVVGVGSPRREPGQPRVVGCGGGDRRTRVPAAPATGAAPRRPARLRQARHAVRGALRVLREGRADLRERGAAPEDGARAGGRHRRRASRCLGKGRGGAAARSDLARGRGAPARAAGVVGRGGGHDGCIDVRARPAPGRATRRAVDREAAGRVPDGDRGEAHPGPGRAGRARDAECRVSPRICWTRSNSSATSRQRLVTAQDEERRKLERNLHDGAQQQIVALTVKLGLLERIVEGTRAGSSTIAGTAAGGRDRGAGRAARPRARYLPAAAGRQGVGRGARVAGTQVGGVGHGRGRRHRAVRARGRGGRLFLLPGSPAERREVRLGLARHRCRSRTATGAPVRGDRRRRRVRPGVVIVRHGLQGIADRLAALDGELKVRSAPGAGTSVAGMLPVSAS